MHYIRYMRNATSKSNLDFKSNFRLFQSLIRQRRLSNLVDSDVPSQRYMRKWTIELGNDNNVQYY